jgi:hypothetical protein
MPDGTKASRAGPYFGRCFAQRCPCRCRRATSSCCKSTRRRYLPGSRRELPEQSPCRCITVVCQPEEKLRWGCQPTTSASRVWTALLDSHVDADVVAGVCSHISVPDAVRPLELVKGSKPKLTPRVGWTGLPADVIGRHRDHLFWPSEWPWLPLWTSYMVVRDRSRDYSCCRCRGTGSLPTSNQIFHRDSRGTSEQIVSTPSESCAETSRLQAGTCLHSSCKRLQSLHRMQDHTL